MDDSSAVFNVIGSPPKGNNTNTEANSGFVLFFSNDYFGIRIEFNGRKNQIKSGE